MSDLTDTLANILRTIKDGLGIPNDVVHFDATLITHINSVSMILNSLGVGPDDIFILTTGDESWEDFLGEVDEVTFALVKSYFTLKIKVLFDPPTTGILTGSLDRVIAEFESRLVYQAVATAEE